jgi:hypothetical protein
LYTDRLDVAESGANRFGGPTAKLDAWRTTTIRSWVAGAPRRPDRVCGARNIQSSRGPDALTRVYFAALAFLLGCCAAADAVAQRAALPAMFVAEHVALRVVPDSLQVDGVYVFVCRQDTASVPWRLLYPYPQDPLLGDARTVQLAYRLGAQPWQDLSWRELPGGRGALWSLPLAAGDTLRVRTMYRQALRTTYARYIVTTTAAWGQPLQSARFTIHLPPGTVPEEFSFPFEPCGQDEPAAWCFEATDFLPDRDVTVRWRLVGEQAPER